MSIPKFNKSKLDKILSKSMNKTLGEVDVNNVFYKTINNPKVTGIAGDVIEQSVFGLSPDTKQRPDLDVDGIEVELKTTGIRKSKRNRKQYEAKEPMSITAVSPPKIIYEDFYTSNFWRKLEHSLFVFYDYDSDTTVKAADYATFYLRGYLFHEFDKKDEKILKSDWELVRDFIKHLNYNYESPEEEYPRLSSELRKDLMYIDTAPKWPNPPRFRLKRKVVSSIVQKHFGYKLEELPEEFSSFAEIDKKCQELEKKFSNKTIKELMRIFNITGKPSKSISEQIVVEMFGGSSKKISNIGIFNKSGIIGKTITLTSKRLRKEDMKLFSIDFDEWTDQEKTFEDSYIYEYFSTNQFLCIIFEESSNKVNLSNNIFKGFKRLSFSDNFINKHVKTVWDEVRRLVLCDLLEETEIHYKGTTIPIINPRGTIRTSINFPKSKDHLVFIRGTSSHSEFKTEEVNGIKMYKQYIWIKGKTIVDLINEY